MVTTTYCTKFDHFYMDRGLALYSSLRKYHPTAELYVLALSHEAAAFLEEKALPGLHVVRVQDLLRAEPRLESALSDRTLAERAFTLTPFVVMQTLKHCQVGDMVVYLDADMLFFGSVTALLRDAQSADVIVSPHNFSSHMAEQQRFGIYNTAFTAFRKTTDGQRCVDWWAEQCLEWCCDRLENGKFADQKYIENFSSVALKTVPITHPGLNCGPWNVSGRQFQTDKGSVLVDGQPLILYHFAKIKRICPWCLATRIKLQGVMRTHGLNRCVYRPYAHALDEAATKYEVPEEWMFGNNIARHAKKYRGFEKDNNPDAIATLLRILRGEYVSANYRNLLRGLLGRQRSRCGILDEKVDQSNSVNRPLRQSSIAIVTPSYNQAEWLPTCLRSIAEQNYPHLQHIVMDAGSADKSREIIQSFSHHLYHTQSKKDNGQYPAINHGFRLSSSSVMGWLNSDDLHFPWTLSIVGEIFATFPQIRWLTTCYPLVIDKNGKPLRCAEVMAYSKLGVLKGETLPGSRGYILHGIQQESTFWHRDLWEEVGGTIDTKYDFAGDYDLWMRFARKADIYCVALPLAAFRRHGDQKTSRYMERYCSQAMESFRLHGRGFSSRRQRAFARQVVPKALKPLAAKLGLLYPAKIVKRVKDTGQWAVQEIFA